MSARSFVLGVDQGICGGNAFYCSENPDEVVADDMPVAAGMVDAATFAARIIEMKIGAAFVERVGSMPRQGVSSTFRFGQASGIVIGVLVTLKIPIHLVAPTVWKKHFHLSSDKGEELTGRNTRREKCANSCLRSSKWKSSESICT
jgi:crossover junction endodeoxyribonuclease RuvC